MVLNFPEIDLSIFLYDLCWLDINECERINCSGNGACKDLINGFFCDCDAGFAGDFCEAGMFCPLDVRIQYNNWPSFFLVLSTRTVIT